MSSKIQIRNVRFAEKKNIISPGQAKKKTIFAITGKFHYLLFKPALRQRFGSQFVKVHKEVLSPNDKSS